LVNVLAETQNDKGFTFPALAVDEICADFSQKCTHDMGKNLNGIDISNATVEGKIDVLIGSDIYWSIVTGEILNSFKGPVAMNSIFGWLISGSVEASQNDCKLRTYYSEISVKTDSPSDIKQSLKNIMGSDDEEGESNTLKTFKDTIIYKNSRYTVKLPWRKGFELKDSNFEISYSRLNNLLKSLKIKNKFNQYNEIFRSYLNKGYIEQTVRDSREYFIPHHAVMKNDRETTKMRIVFDGSVGSKSKISLNDCLDKGPSLLQDLTNQLVKFRIGQNVVIGDLREAFLQIEIDEIDRPMLKFMWYTDQKIVFYRFCRLPFGLSCSPFILNATLQYHLGSDANYFYVDDFIYTTDCEKELLKMTTDMIYRTKKAGFELRKLKTNNVQLQNNILFDNENDIVSVLGLNYNIFTDKMYIKNVPSLEKDLKYTKRSVLSLITQYFDPLGLFFTCNYQK